MSKNKRPDRREEVTPSNGTSNEPANSIASINTPTKTRSERQYEIYRSVDPFPNIEPALLNYVDAYRYIYTCGIIDEFHEEKLNGITYACSFSGNAYFCKPDEKEMQLLAPDEDGYYTISSNSITYLEIAETIRVPEYLALRFNLSVSNAFKGLLLGTGPIVDPGFVGKLYIPLHNLTANTFKIKKGAELILIEFTKQSRNEKWKNTESPADITSPIIKTKEIDPLRTFKKYITKALTGKDDFRNKYDANYVSSSIPEAIKESVDKASDSEKKASEALDTVNKIRNSGIFAICLAVLGIIVTGFTLLIPTWQSFDSFHKERCEYQEKISNLQLRLTSLEIDDKQENLDLLKDEYASIVDKNTDSAIKLNEQIIKSEKEIEVLQGQLP